MSWRMLMPQMGQKWRQSDSPLLQPVNPVKFLTRSTCAYSIGSCFAVNINRWLRHQGFAVPEVSWGNHYNSRTILYELSRAAGLPAPNVDWRVPKSDGTLAYGDALRHCVDTQSVEELIQIKEQIAGDSRRNFAKAEAFLITLGLSDSWETEIDGELITLNRAPYLGAQLLNDTASDYVGNRFLTVNECVEDLRQIVRLIRTCKPADTPIVFSISPVPLKHAGGNLHPQIANSRSKATLLAAIFSFLDDSDCDSYVSYFPSYEFFQTNPLGMSLWQGDDRHPTVEAVGHVAESFLMSYSSEELTVKPGFTVPIFA